MSRFYDHEGGPTWTFVGLMLFLGLCLSLLGRVLGHA